KGNQELKEMIKYQKGIDKIVILTLDMEGQNRNIINHKITPIFIPVLKQLQSEIEKKQLKGVIITSGKKEFLQGGDLSYLHEARREDADFILKKTEELKSIFRQIECLGVPVVAAINGTATGIGYELTLACHHRVALNKTGVLLGLPEVKLGLIQGGGGISRLTWLMGVERALSILIEGQLVRPKEALELGLIDKLVDSESELIETARRWIKTNPFAKQPWDAAEERLSNRINNDATPQWIMETTAQMMKRFKRNLPAVTAILDIMVNSLSLNFDTTNRLESRYFTKMVMHPSAKNMTKAFWFDINAIKKGIARPKGFGRFRPRQIGVIGSGQMGSAIAAMAALEGMDVVLKDVSQPIADRGKIRAKRVLEKRFENKKIAKEEIIEALSKIATTTKVSDFEACDLVIEAVFENVSVKTKVIKEAANYMDEYAMFASNTSSLSISRLAKASSQPENFIGLKFFRPVEETRIVEVICGIQTSDETKAKAIDFVRKIKKLPIVIQDRRGFFTTRVMEAYGLEGIALLKDGCPPVVIEQTAINAGMKLGPLAMMDEISIANTLMFEERKMKIFQPYWYPKELEVMRQMVQDFGRAGKMSRAGFYDYDENGKKQLWGDLEAHFKNDVITLTQAGILERLMFAQVLEALRCLDSGVVDNVEEVNIASIHGWGFSVHKGGALQFINDYGVKKFLARTKELSDEYGHRFSPPSMLIEKAEKGELF
ncbi:MAG: 3-hydroxyacyl-CoA dehydrogenase NAD-binding domain-containing protein, partial [Saprospiraceae bacterium]